MGLRDSVPSFSSVFAKNLPLLCARGYGRESENGKKLSVKVKTVEEDRKGREDDNKGIVTSKDSQQCTGLCEPGMARECREGMIQKTAPRFWVLRTGGMSASCSRFSTGSPRCSGELCL